MKVSFKGKAKEQCIIVDGSPKIIQGVKVPEITRSHCDMNSFRQSKQFGSYANSDLFSAVLKRFFRDNDIPKVIDINNPPSYVDIKSGFLSSITLDLSKIA